MDDRRRSAGDRTARALLLGPGVGALTTAVIALLGHPSVVGAAVALVGVLLIGAFVRTQRSVT